MFRRSVSFQSGARNAPESESHYYEAFSAGERMFTHAGGSALLIFPGRQRSKREPGSRNTMPTPDHESMRPIMLKKAASRELK